MVAVNYDEEYYGKAGILTPDLLDRMDRYLDERQWQDFHHVIPNLAAMCVLLGISSFTFRQWLDGDGSGEYRDRITKFYARLMDEQQAVLLAGGLSGAFNSTIAKVLLSKHGFSEKTSHEFTQGQLEDANSKPAIFIGVGSEEKQHSTKAGLVVDEAKHDALQAGIQREASTRAPYKEKVQTPMPAAAPDKPMSFRERRALAGRGVNHRTKPAHKESE
jgi:hypothetical protein